MSLLNCLPQISFLGRETAIIIMTGLFMVAVFLLILKIRENTKLKEYLGID